MRSRAWTSQQQPSSRQANAWSPESLTATSGSRPSTPLQGEVAADVERLGAGGSGARAGDQHRRQAGQDRAADAPPDAAVADRRHGVSFVAVTLQWLELVLPPTTRRRGPRLAASVVGALG